MSHGDPVIDSDGVEFGGKTAFVSDDFLELLADFMQMHMARNKLGEGIDDSNDRPVHVLFSHTVGPPETAGPSHSSALGCGSTAKGDSHNCTTRKENPPP